MISERIELGQGIALNVIPCQKFKTNAIAIRFLCPMKKETAAENALLPFVLKRGTERLPTMTHLSKELQMLYGTELQAQVGKTGDLQFFGFAAVTLNDDYTEGEKVTERALALLSELLHAPLTVNGTLCPDFVESEKRVMIERIREAINHKTSYAVKRCYEEMGRDDPAVLPETGTEEQIEAITAEGLTARWREALAACRIEIFCAGDFDTEKLTDTCRSLFRSAERRPVPLTETVPLPHAEEVRCLSEDQPVKQGKLSLGFTTSLRPSPETAARYNLFLEVLANSPTAKLFLNVREKLSLCYYCSAVPDRPKGILILTSGIEVADRAAAEEAILNEIDACREGKITEEELTAAKKALKTAADSITDDYGAMISWVASQLTWERKLTPEEYVASAMRVTVEDLRATADTLKLHTVYFMNGTQTEEEASDDDR